MELTVPWMRILAPLLGVMPADLITSALVASAENEVTPADDEPFASSLMLMGHRGYRVTPEGKYVVNAGVKPGDPIVVDETPDRISNLRSLDILLLRVRSPEDEIDALVLRQYIAPDILISNCNGESLMGRLTDPRVEVKGVVLQQKPGA